MLFGVLPDSNNRNREKDLMEIPAYSIMAIPDYPNYILESPPNSIVVRKRGISSGDEKITQRVLEVVEY